jgi:hypothetical protein
MNLQIPPPFVCALAGATVGAIAGGCQTFPVCVGAATGASLGCAMCICLCFANPPEGLPVAKIIQPQQTIVNHIHIYEMSTGAQKDTIPKS